MAKNQKDYLADILGGHTPDAGTKKTNARGDEAAPPPSPTDRPADRSAPAARSRGTTLPSRESALARVSSGEVKQVTQLLLDPARVRVWEGNARAYDQLTKENCRELIDALIAEGGQKVPAVVRKVSGGADHDYEVIAGTRRHWSITLLRANNYPDMAFLAQVADLDDEAAFRLADIENRAREDVSDLERARNYAAALGAHYGGHQARMAERLKLSQGWLSKMLKVAALPNEVVEAFASPMDIRLQPTYKVAQAYTDETRRERIVRNAVAVSAMQHNRRVTNNAALGAADVIRRLLDTQADKPKGARRIVIAEQGRPSLSVRSTNRQGITVRIHDGHGLNRRQLMQSFGELLDVLEETTGGIGR